MFLSRLAESVEPYTAGEQIGEGYVKLNTNENPYPPSPRAAKTLRESDASRLRLYPQPNADGLRRAIAQAEGVDEENVFCANGSDEALALCFPAFFDEDGKGACFADVTYSFYPVFASFFRIPTVVVPVKEDYSIDLAAMAKADCGGYFIANPNAPTSLGIGRAQIEAFVASVDKLVILDEAYMDFFGESCAALTKRYANLLVVKTFSKSYSLAGMRCGYAIGQSGLIEGLRRMRDCFNSYPVDAVCQAVCAAAVSDRSYHDETVRLVVSERERLKTALRSRGLWVADSASNFLFVRFSETGGKYIYESLKAKKILVRFWDKPKLSEFCRITVGTPSQNEALLEALDTILR